MTPPVPPISVPPLRLSREKSCTGAERRKATANETFARSVSGAPGRLNMAGGIAELLPGALTCPLRYACARMTALVVSAFLTLFVLLDPIGLAPLFLGLTSSRTRAERQRIAKKAVLVAGGLLLVFTLAGHWLLAGLGISLDAFRVAGGILLFRIAVDMVFAHLERETAQEESEARARSDISVFPLAIPLIAGPGALASVMILAGVARAYPWGLATLLLVGGGVLVLVYLALRLASSIAGLLGQTGINVVTRVLGVLLAALATQYVADGIRGLLRSGTP